MSGWPRMAAQCSGVQPSVSSKPALAPMNSSSRTVMPNPLYAAQCSAVRWSPSRASISPFHCVSRRKSVSVCPYWAHTWHTV